MIKIKNGVITREPVPEFISNWDYLALRDLSKTDPALGLQGSAWYPEVDESPALNQYQHYGPETLTFDPERQVVVRVRPAVEMTAADLGALKKQFMTQIDDAVAAKIITSTRFSMAYQERENAAIEFRDANYVGTPSDWIARFANNTGMTYKAATDLILKQADGLRNALKTLDNLRMDKYLVMPAVSAAQAESTLTVILNSIATVVIP